MKRNEEYNRGLDREVAIISRLSEAMPHFTFEKSSAADDKQRDIDAWAVCDNTKYAVSIKSQAKAAKSGRVLFELEVLQKFKEDDFNRLDDRIERDNCFQWGDYHLRFDSWIRSFDKKGYRRFFAWKLSTFHTSKCDFFVIEVGPDLLVIETRKLRQFVRRNGWLTETRLSPEVRAAQAKMGHPHIDATCGLLKIKTIIDNELGYFL